ncbi:MAG TPA: hypothetical protein VHO06_27805, partial [Polyangia bacterium]|nr:hypothetical protein [Polyangia bacterium]
MSARWITDAEELVALGPAWAALCDRVPSSSPFERPEWLLPWVTVFGGRRRLRVLALERAGRLAALVPLVEAEANGAQRLGFLGAGVSDYHDAVLADDGPDLRAELWRALARGAWTTCTLERLRPGSPLLGPVPAGAEAIGGEPTAGEVCPALAAAPGARSLGDLVPEGYARRLARARRRAEAHHRLGFRSPATAA